MERNKKILEIRKKEAKNISNLFKKNDVIFTIIKYYPYDYSDDDIDFVVNKKQFKKTIELLKKEGYKDDRKLKKGHIAHLREPLKIAFKSKKKEFKIHLHKTFSWNGVEYLNPKEVHKRHILNKDGLYTPSYEDQYLIIIAHSMFENNYVKKIELDYFNKLQRKKLDSNYIKKMAKEYNWEHAIPFFIKNKTRNLFKFRDILKISYKKLLKDFISFKWRYIIREAISYTIIAYFWCYRSEIKKRNQSNNNKM